MLVGAVEKFLDERVGCGARCASDVGGGSLVEVNVPTEHVNWDVSVEVTYIKGVVLDGDAWDGFEVVAEFAQQHAGPSVAGERGGWVAVGECSKSSLEGAVGGKE